MLPSNQDNKPITTGGLQIVVSDAPPTTVAARRFLIGSTEALTYVATEGLSGTNIYEYLDVVIGDVVWISSKSTLNVSTGEGAPVVASWSDPLARVREIRGYSGTTLRLSTTHFADVLIWGASAIRVGTPVVDLPDGAYDPKLNFLAANNNSCYAPSFPTITGTPSIGTGWTNTDSNWNMVGTSTGVAYTQPLANVGGPYEIGLIGRLPVWPIPGIGGPANPRAWTWRFNSYWMAAGSGPQTFTLPPNAVLVYQVRTVGVFNVPADTVQLSVRITFSDGRTWAQQYNSNPSGQVVAAYGFMNRATPTRVEIEVSDNITDPARYAWVRAVIYDNTQYRWISSAVAVSSSEPASIEFVPVTTVPPPLQFTTSPGTAVYLGEIAKAAGAYNASVVKDRI